MIRYKQSPKRTNILIEKEASNIKERWKGPPNEKLPIPILWERGLPGFIDPTKGLDDYIVDGKKDEHDNLIKETSINLLTSLIFDAFRMQRPCCSIMVGTWHLASIASP